jgi:putative flippase GtrA
MAALPRQVGVFAVIGVLSTVAYLALYVVLRSWVGPQVSNATALLITAVANTAANRRWTFAGRGRSGVWRQQAEGLVVFGIGLAVSSGALALVHAVRSRPGTVVEVSALVVANGLATLARFVLLRSWVFNPGRAGPATRASHVIVTEGQPR